MWAAPTSIRHRADKQSVAPPLRYKFIVFLLDTNVVSEPRKIRPHGAVVAWIEGVADADLYLSAVTLGEIQAGIEITREQDAAKAAEIRKWADQVGAAYDVLPMDAVTFR